MQTLLPAQVPTELEALIARLMSLLLAGEHPTLHTLRAQYAVAVLRKVVLSGVGFFAEFAVPDGVPLTEPRAIVGGDVPMTLKGVRNGAGCVLFISDGRLQTLEGYTYDEPWPERPVLLSTGVIQPVVAPAA